MKKTFNDNIFFEKWNVDCPKLIRETATLWQILYKANKKGFLENYFHLLNFQSFIILRIG